jgi:hypothetical protein
VDRFGPFESRQRFEEYVWNTWTFDDEDQARATVRRLLVPGGDGWRDLPGSSSTGSGLAAA